jgi:alpha-D-xyloside xylohydrolase
VYEGQRSTKADQRVFILTRSAFAGQQRYGSVTWSGDIVTRWSDFRDQISAGVNFSLSGIPWWTMDIGGFAVEPRYYNPSPADLDEWRELNTRWFQFGAFCPLFRVHGQYPFREMFNIAPKGHEVFNTLVYYDRLRYRLMPYIYSTAARSSLNDYTMMRGLVMDFSSDTQVRAIDDQYMFGPSLLVSPVTEFKARNRSVYLPKGAGWYDFHSGKFYEGGQTLNVAAPLNTLPLFVKAGAIIPAGPPVQYVDEKPADPITLYVFTGADGTFDLYEDDGSSYAFESGEFSTIPMRYNEATGTLTIGKRQGSYKGMLDNRTFHMVWVKRESPVGVGLSATPQQVVQYTGEPVEVKLN